MGEEMKAEKSKISPTSAALKVGEFWAHGMNRVCDSFYDKAAINFIALNALGGLYNCIRM
jgi:hypothetical protein